MIELGTISIKDETSIVDATNKIRFLAEDLGLGPITTARLATMTFKLSRRMAATSQMSNIKVALDKRDGVFGLVLLFTSGQPMKKFDLNVLEAVFDDVEVTETPDGLESVKAFKFLTDSEFEPTEEFIDKEKKLVQRLTREELYLQLKEYSERLEEMVEERTKELREAQEQLVRSEKLAVLGQLAGGVAHELRNPLGAIKNASYFLNMALEEPEPEVKETLGILEREVATSERIISSLLGFARPRPPTRRKVVINEVIQGALSRNTVPENVQMVTQLDESLSTIPADPDQLSQVFTNIIGNAIQAMPEGGQLLVKSEVPSPKWVAVSFADTGVGIPPEELQKVFEPLFTTKAKGIGLGLAVTKTLVEGHGGTIEVQSKPGKGSTFTVKLPIGREKEK